MRIWYRFLTCVKYWYHFFSCARIWYQLSSCVRNWTNYPHVRGNGTDSSYVEGITSSHPENRSQVQQILTNSLHVRNYQIIFHMCEEWVPILNMCEESKLIFHMCEKSVSNLHTSEMINMRNLSTNFRPLDLSKLAIRNFHI